VDFDLIDQSLIRYPAFVR